MTEERCIATLAGHGSWVGALAALPDGQLASLSLDSTIKLWDVQARACVAAYVCSNSKLERIFSNF